MTASPYLRADVAAVYRRIAAPIQFGPPACDLVAMLEPGIGGALLDVGSGTGAVAIAASQAVGPAGLVIGIDPSLEMLRASRADGIRRVGVARLPELPFRGDTFDAVAASFVLSHLDDYPAALAEMVRVCRPGGRVGITSWGAGPNPIAQAWKDVAATFAPADRLQQAFRAMIPWDEWLSHPDNLGRALREARLTRVETTRREYRYSMTANDFLSMKEASVEGTLLHGMLDAEAWFRFARRVADVFRDRFPDTLTFLRDVHFGTGTK